MSFSVEADKRVLSLCFELSGRACDLQAADGTLGLK